MTVAGDQPTDGPIRFGTPTARWVLLGTVLGSGMVSLDATVVNIALPRLGDDLDASFAGLQWVVTGYTLTLASLILVGGSLGDRFGRRRVFILGVTWFAVASLLSGAAPGIGALVVARMLQGVGGALLTPGSLAIIQSSFHPDDRARAIGAWSGFAGITTAIGPLTGGWLVDAASWRWIFLLNLPLAGLVVWIAVRHMPESRAADTSGRVDVPGAVLCVIGLTGATWGLIERSWPLGAIGVAGLVAFVVVEYRSRHPMLPLTIFRSRQFTTANIVTLLIYGGLGAVLFLIGLVLQESLGYSPIEAGLATFPITVIMLTFSARAGALAQRIGPRLPMTLGPAVMAIGMLLMTRIEPGRSYVAGVLPGLIVFAGGLALTVAPLTATVLAAADPAHSGIASGVNNAMARVGALLAVAAVPMVAGFSPGVPVSPAVLVDGFHSVLLVAAALVAIGAVGSWVGIRSTLLETGTPDDVTPIEDRPPCFHCGADAPPLVVHGGG